MDPAQVVVLVAGPDPLVLPGVLLREHVGHVAIGPAHEHGEAELVAQVVGGVIEARKPALRITGVVEVGEVRRIEEPVRPGTVHGAVGAEVLRATAEGESPFVGRETCAAAVDLAVEGRAQAGLGGQMDHGARLLAVLRGDVAVDELDGLGDAGIDRVRERHARLVGDGLAVEHVLALAVEALEMEAAVLILREPGRGGEQLLDGAGGDGGRRARDVRLVDVDVRGRGVGLELCRGWLRGDGHRLRSHRDTERDVDLGGRRRPHVDRAVLRPEALRVHVQLVGVERHVEELEGAVVAGDGTGLEPRDVVPELERDPGQWPAIRPQHLAANRSRLRPRLHGDEQHDDEARHDPSMNPGHDTPHG